MLSVIALTSTLLVAIDIVLLATFNVSEAIVEIASKFSFENTDEVNSFTFCTSELSKKDDSSVEASNMNVGLIKTAELTPYTINNKTSFTWAILIFKDDNGIIFLV